MLVIVKLMNIKKKRKKKKRGKKEGRNEKRLYIEKLEIRNLQFMKMALKYLKCDYFFYTVLRKS